MSLHHSAGKVLIKSSRAASREVAECKTGKSFILPDLGSVEVKCLIFLEQSAMGQQRTVSVEYPLSPRNNSEIKIVTFEAVSNAVSLQEEINAPTFF